MKYHLLLDNILSVLNKNNNITLNTLINKKIA